MKTIFTNYIGSKVLVDESEKIVELNSLGTRAFKVYSINSNDKIINEIKSKAKKESLIFRLWLPSTVGTMDLRGDRLNVRVGKVDDEFQITKIYVG